MDCSPAHRTATRCRASVRKESKEVTCIRSLAVVFLTACTILPACSDDAPQIQDAQDDASIDASPDANSPLDASRPRCTSLIGSIPCWDYAGPEQIGDQTCEHVWLFDTSNTACIVQNGWTLEGGVFVTFAGDSVFSVELPDQLADLPISLQVFYAGDAQYRDTDFMCGDTTCMLPSADPDDCLCPLRNSQTVIELLLDDVAQVTATSLATSSVEVFAHLYTDEPWDSVRISAIGDGDGRRSFHDIRVLTRTSI